MNSKVFGSILIVAGTSIGASMLALPMISSSLGEIKSLFLLIMVWLLGYYSSLMVLKVNLFYKGAFSISELCKKSFDFKIWLIADLSIITLFYSLLAAYISGIVEISMLENMPHSSNLLSNGVIGYLVVVILVFFIIFNFKVLDVSNRIIFVMKIGVFITMLYFLSSKVELSNLKNFNGYLLQNNDLFKAIPVFFTSFGFHGSIPSIMKYLDNNEKDIKKAFLWGSFLSLIVYCLWIFFTSAVLPKYGLISFDAVNNSDNKLHELIKMLAERTEQDKLHVIISVFSWMAIITSFLGVGVGLYDYILEKFKFKREVFKDQLKGIFITFFPPLLIAILGKNIFVKALAFAAISLSMLAIILPAFIALKLGQKNKIAIIMSLILGMLIVIIELVNFL
ncbi:aromatic amino acid transport family protein [Candidatus Bandiella numerosa]|uniref:aromatic amino acid transport family protein n=1 Tax=Candidatus Bandiella numerosa TaxID=2570586 RepID=UPI001F1A4420|nr:aromatic amino acid transport family protein [Candidatus Bandiella numerosa]